MELNSLTFRLRAGGLFLLALFVFVVTELLATMIAATLNRLFTGTASPSSRLAFESLYRPTHLLLVTIAFSGLLQFERPPQPALAGQGLPLGRTGLKHFSSGCAIGCGLVSFAVLAIKLFGGLHFAPANTPATLTLTATFLVLWVLLAAAMLEEVVFRGYPFQRLIDAIGPIAATALLSLFFGAVHLRNPGATWLGALNTVLVGVLFSLAYLRTKALWLPFGIHFAWNATMGLLFGLPVSGFTLFSVLWQGAPMGPTWLTGGAYGIEASFTGTAVILLGIGILTLVPSQKMSDSNGDSAHLNE